MSRTPSPPPSGRVPAPPGLPMTDREAINYWQHMGAWLRQLMPEHFTPAPPAQEAPSHE